MKLPSLALVIGLCVLTTTQESNAQDPALHGAESRAAWRAFQAAEGSGWTAEWNAATGTPRAIYGNGLKVAPQLTTLDEARVQSNLVLTRHATLLGRGDSRFVETSSARVRHLFYFLYKEQYKGLDVIGARADVRINERGVIAMFGASAVPIQKTFGIDPVLNATAARKMAEGRVLGGPGPKKDLTTRLVIWAETHGNRPTAPVLAWEVHIDARPTRFIVGRSYVDARTGARLEFRNDVYNCRDCKTTHVRGSGRHHDRMQRSLARAALVEPRVQPTAQPDPKRRMVPLTGRVMAWTNVGLKPTDPLQNIPLRNLKVTSPVGSAFTDANGDFSIPNTGNTPVTVSAILEGRHCKAVLTGIGTPLSVSAPITPGTPGTLQFGTATMGEKLHAQTSAYYWVDRANIWLRGHVPTRTTEMNRIDGLQPTVNTGGACNGFYSNLTIRMLNSSATCHHASYSTFLLHEWGHGLDDVFGGIVFTDGLSEGWADLVAILNTKSPLIFDAFWKTRTPSWVRSALNTKTYPHAGGTHAKGEVWMGLAWDVRINLINSLGQTQGSDRTENIFIPTIVANAQNMAAAVREVFLLDDDDGNLNNGTPNYFDLEKACIKRTVPFPKIQAGSVTHIPLPGTSQQLTPRIVRATAKALIGTFTKVEMVYDVGSGAQRREMVPTGSNDEYLALLPGVLSPVDVQYHIEATHSLNKVFRAPDVGEFGYSVGQESVFFTDDFETVKPGWSSGPLLGTVSDFARGRPSGSGGTSWGVNWNDPNGAFSGTNCWGNNLNGAYRGTQASFLRAPTLNLTGKTNVKLRFRRWLQIQDGRYDVARITLNGNEIWSNPKGTHLVDQSWAKFEMRVAAADNNPSVQLEWQLLADGGMELAGWNIDDVTLFSFQALPPPKVQLVISPAQVGLGKRSAVAVQGTANAPMVLLVSPNPGPLQIPGIPTLHVGTPFEIFPAMLDGNGDLKFNFTAPTSSTALGQLTYGHVLELTSANTLTASNPSVVLFAK